MRADEKPMMHVPFSPAIIVGTGHVGFQTAASLRECGFQGGVVQIGDEAGLPYRPPPLSKSILHPDTLDARPYFREASFFVATGTRPHRPGGAERQLQGVLFLRNMADANRMRPLLQAAGGLPQRTDDAVMRGNPDSGHFSVFPFGAMSRLGWSQSMTWLSIWQHGSTTNSFQQLPDVP